MFCLCCSIKIHQDHKRLLLYCPNSTDALSYWASELFVILLIISLFKNVYCLAFRETYFETYLPSQRLPTNTININRYEYVCIDGWVDG